MKYIIIFLLSLSCLKVDCQNDNRIVIGNIDSIQSHILNEQRKIWVYVPDMGKSHEHYPVVYLLDGDAHFFSVVGMIQQLSSVNGNDICPKMIVVAIPNTNRTRDLTPSHIIVDPPFMDSASSSQSGGGENFISFIKNELIPHIDSAYPTAPYKILIGHSFGGLTVMNTLINHKNLFNAYVAIDPSMWWDNQKLLKQAKEILAHEDFSGKSLFLGIANTMRPGMDTFNVQKDVLPMSRHIRSILELNKSLQKNKQNHLVFDSKYYVNDNHGSVPLITEYDALHFIFNFYPAKIDFEQFVNIRMVFIKSLEAHYSKISNQMGYEMLMPEDFTNMLGYQAMAQKHWEEAEYLFKMNVQNHPTGGNVYDSLGDYYSQKGDKNKAIENYNKALAIQFNSDTRQKLDNLQSK